jgi:hypothetical protein
MNKYINNKISVTIGVVMISTMLTIPTWGSTSSYEQLPNTSRHVQARDYSFTVKNPSTYDPAKNALTGTYTLSSETDFEDVITNFFTRLSSEQEPLEAEFEQVLFDNIWDMYQE